MFSAEKEAVYCNVYMRILCSKGYSIIYPSTQLLTHFVTKAYEFRKIDLNELPFLILGNTILKYKLQISNPT